MPIDTSLIDNGDGTKTLRMDFTGESQKVLNIGSESGEYFYNKNWTLYNNDVDGGSVKIPWHDLTNQEKMDVLGKETKQHLKNGAFSLYKRKIIETAEESMQPIDDRYGA